MGNKDAPCKVNMAREKTITNGDMIRSMTDEELADFFDVFRQWSVCAYYDIPGCGSGGCRKDIGEWLKQPAAE